MEYGNDKQSLDLEQTYIRSQTSAWDKDTEIRHGPTVKGVPFMPQAPDAACFQQVYDALAAKLRSDQFSHGIKALAAIERELRRAREHGDPRKIEQMMIRKSLTTLRHLDPAIATLTRDCLRTEASTLSAECLKLIETLLEEDVAPFAQTG